YRVERRPVEVRHHDIARTTVSTALILRGDAPPRHDAGPHGVGEPQRAHRYGSPTDRGARGLARRADGDGTAEALVLIRRRDFEMVGVSIRSEEHTSELQSLAYLVCRL